MPQIPSSLPSLAPPPGGGLGPGRIPWTPKFPGFAVAPQTGSNQGPDSGGLPYEPTPASSHVYGFKMLASGFVSKFLAPANGAAPGTRAILMVAFKPNPPRGSTTHPNVPEKGYEYYFPIEAACLVWFNRMKGHAHPGEVVQDLIKAGIPYKRVFG